MSSTGAASRSQPWGDRRGSYTDSGLDATTAHEYYVTALDAAGLEGPASNVVVRSPADDTAPTAPGGLTRTISGFTVRLTWTASADDRGVTGYTVYRGGVAVGTTSTGTSYADYPRRRRAGRTPTPCGPGMRPAT